MTVPTWAQSSDTSLVDQFRNAQQERTGETSSTTLSPLDERSTVDSTRSTSQFPSTSSVRLETSPLEKDYRQRLQSALTRPAEPGEERLTQFGYNMFVNRTNSQVPAGAVSDDYQLGIGDEIVITYRGQRSNTVRTRVDREGRLVLPSLSPVEVAGRRFGEVRDEILALVSQTFPQTDAFISVGAVRSIGVYVLGEVRRPGLHRVNGLSSLIDVLIAAGGPRKTGTLRNVVITHGGVNTVVDLYALLINGHLDQDISLSEDDRIFVGALGPTVAIAGDVRRPGIYELKKGAGLRSGEALAFAGGALRPNAFTAVRISTDRDGHEQAITLNDTERASLNSGDILLMVKARNDEIGGFVLDGHVAAPGVHPLQAEPTIRALLSDVTVLKDNPYLLFAALETTDPETHIRHYIPVDLSRIMDGGTDISFHPKDKLIVLGMDDIRYLNSADVREVILNDRKKSNDSTQQNGQNQQYEYAQEKEPARNSELKGDSDLRSDYQQTGNDYNQVNKSNYSSMPDEMALEQSRMGSNTNPDSSNLTRNGNSQAGLGNQSIPKSDDTRVVTTTGRSFHLPQACVALRHLASVLDDERRTRLSLAVQTVETKSSSGNEMKRDRALVNRMPCRDVYERNPELLSFVLDYVAVLQGEVRLPGAYPILPDAPVSKLITASGGLVRNADLSSIEVSHFDADSPQSDAMDRQVIDWGDIRMQKVSLNPGDAARINAIFSNREPGPIVLHGEVKHPGIYAIHRGEKLSEILARAGGLTPEAYPLGTVFTRERVRKDEEVLRDKAAHQFEMALTQALTSGRLSQDTTSKDQVSLLNSMVQSIKSAEVKGRIAVEADPTVLAVHPDLDTILEAGDMIEVPKRPNYITVAGEVLSPMSMHFQSELQPNDYIEQAGGLTQAADIDRAYVLYPNGIAKPLQTSSWNFTSMHMPPGSTVVIPRDPTPFETWTFTKDLIDIASKLALTGASLAVISN